MKSHDLKFNPSELIAAARMSSIDPADIPSTATPWDWQDPRAFSWRSSYRSINPAMAERAEIALGEPLSLALQAALDGGETLTAGMARELQLRRPALHQQMRQEAMQRAIDQIGENRKAEAASRAANTPTPAQLAEQLRQSKQEAINGQQGRVPMPVQISDV